MSRVMNTHPDVASFGETMFWGRRYRPTNAEGCWSRDDLDALADELPGSLMGPSGNSPGALATPPEALLQAIEQTFRALDTPARPAQVYKAMCRAVLDAEGKTIAIEKTPHHLNWIDRIEQALPGSRFLIMQRDAYGFMLSYKHQGDHRGEQLRRNLKSLYHPIGCALVWRGYMRSILDVTRRYPDQTLVVDLAREPDEGALLQRVASFFALPPGNLEGRVHQNSSFARGDRPELSGADRFWLNLIARKEIAACGTDKQPARLRDSLAVLGSVMYTPLWAFRAWFHMRRNTQGSTFAYLWRWIRR